MAPGKRQTGLDWSHSMNKFTMTDILTLPNLLSFLRIPMAFLFYYFYNWGNGTGGDPGRRDPAGIRPN